MSFCITDLSFVQSKVNRELISFVLLAAFTYSNDLYLAPRVLLNDYVHARLGFNR